MGRGSQVFKNQISTIKISHISHGSGDVFSMPPVARRENNAKSDGWVKISRGAPLEVQNGTQQDLNKMIDLVNFAGKKIVYMLKIGGFEMGPNKI